MTIARSIWIRLLAAGVAAVALLIPAVTLANGWEHAAIPFDALLQALRFPAPETRRRAAVSLGARGQPEAIAPLLKALQRPEPKPRVRGAIYSSLGQLGLWQAGPALLRCLRSEDREEVRAECVVALGELGDKRGLAALLDALAGEQSVLVRSRCVEALGHFSARESVAALATIVAAPTDPGLRPRAIRSLGRTGADAAIEPLLARLAETPGRREQLLIVQALAELGSPRAGPYLRALAEKYTDPELRAHLAMALGAVRDGSAQPTLVGMLRDEVLAVRFYAVRALRQLGRPEAAAALSQMASSYADRAPGQGTEAMLREPVVALARLSLLHETLLALTDLDPQAGLSSLLAAAQPLPITLDSSVAVRLAEAIYEVRRSALYGLGYSGSAQAAETLEGPAGIGDGDFRLRAVAVRSLGVLGKPGTSRVVLPLLEDPAAEVRWTTAVVLGRLGDTQAVSALQGRLTDPHAQVRREVALALGYLGDRRALPVLQTLTQDPRAEVREAAAYALALLSS